MIIFLIRSITYFLCLAICLTSARVQAQAKGSLAAAVQDHFQIYIIDQDRRSPADRTIIKEEKAGNVAVMYYWRNLKERNPSDVICDAYTWLLKGRTRYGKGAKQALNKFAKLDAIELRFFDLEFSTKRGKKKGEILPTQKAKDYLRVRVTKSDFQKPNFRPAWIDQQIKAEKCQSLGKLFKTVWFDKDYIRKRSG